MNYPYSNLLGEGLNRSRRNIHWSTLAAIVAFGLALALLFWGD